jgi:fibronectin-binding autotransporter adhesin
MFLSGSGATSGPSAAFPGAIRNETGLVTSISNVISLASNTTLHVQATGGTGATATPVGSLTFTNMIGGPGKLTLTAPSSNIDQGFLILSGANTYTGGTLVAGGIVQLSGATATLGTANVVVDNATSPSSIARLSILAGVLDGINNGTTLSLAGGGTAATADQNFAILAAGVNEGVGGLILGGVTQTVPGTYGSTTSAATFQNDEYFSGSGVITLIPEPAGLSLLAMAALSLRRRCRRR